MSPHMLTIEYKNGEWNDPVFQAYKPLSLSPAAAGLHYGLQCFEGMKAYKAVSKKDGDGTSTTIDDDDIRLFRPDKNMQRLSNSMERLHMPEGATTFDHQELIACIAHLVRMDQEWIPAYGPGYSLYIRPTVVATDAALGLAAPQSLLLYVITCPVGAYYANGIQPVRLTTDTPYVRAWPGGTGAHKVGGNYAGTIKAQAEADGFDQVLWLHEKEQVTEVGSMNVFFVLDSGDGGVELVTPPLTRGDILPGVTRDSIVHLAQEYDNVTVTERFPTMTELSAAAANGTLREAFGAGTAAVVLPIGCIHHQGRDINIPTGGPLTARILDDIVSIQVRIRRNSSLPITRV